MKVDYIHHCGSDLTTVNAARVSFDKESKWEVDYLPTGNDGVGGIGIEEYEIDVLSEADIKLTKYLADHEHTSPFNHSFITMRVKAPIFVARQLVKHKFMPWNEVSRRYVDSEPEFYEPEVWRKKAKDKKQGSSEEEFHHTDLVWLNNHVKGLRTIYLKLLKEGCCPEQARMVLPQSMYTEWYWSGTLGAWLDMLKLRLKEDTQWETREVAKMCAKIIQPLFPVAYEARLK